MIDPIDNLLSSYDFNLEPARIAQFPVEPRHIARLLIVEEPHQQDLVSCKHAHVWDWQRELNPNDLVVLNDTKVIKARLCIRRPGGGKGELLLIEPLGKAKWLCLAKPAKKIKPGDSIFLESFDNESLNLKVDSIGPFEGGRVIQFPSCYSTREDIETLLNIYGEVPLPPYIQQYDQNTAQRYQTRYADRPGAVAAPTAGLHLSDELLNALKNKGVDFAKVTLHVGIGTFKPIKIEDLKELKLHSEWVEVTQKVVSAIHNCRLKGGRVIAVGTTSLRAIEGAFSKCGGVLQPYKGPVDLVIKPGYQFCLVEGLLTNFHLPKSSLLLLVSALIGRKRLLTLYEKAIESKYRFFSYGDAMWIKPEAVLQEAKPLFKN